MSGHEGKTANHIVEAVTSELKESKCFVTGSASFISSHLADRLVEIGTVIVYHHLRSGRPEFIERHRDRINFRFIKGDFLDLYTLKQAVGGHDVVFHLAAKRGQA